MAQTIFSARARARSAHRVAAWAVCVWALTTCHSYGHFAVGLDGVADAWAPGEVPTTVHAQALDALSIRATLPFVQQGLDAKDVHALRVDSAGLVLLQPSDGSQDLSFLQEVTLFAQAPGQTDVAIASGGPFAAGTNFAPLVAQDVDLSAYVRSGPLRVYGVVQNASAPSAEVQVRLVVDLQAFVGQPGGACWQR